MSIPIRLSAVAAAIPKAGCALCLLLVGRSGGLQKRKTSQFSFLMANEPTLTLLARAEEGPRDERTENAVLRLLASVERSKSAEVSRKRI